jgi:hypothetical protein
MSVLLGTPLLAAARVAYGLGRWDLSVRGGPPAGGGREDGSSKRDADVGPAPASRPRRPRWLGASADGMGRLMRRAVFITVPPRDDYVLRATGLTWNVDRSHGDGSVSRVSVGERDRAVALGALRSLAARDGTDAWAGAGVGVYRLIERNRRSP